MNAVTGIRSAAATPSRTPPPSGCVRHGKPPATSHCGPAAAARC